MCRCVMVCCMYLRWYVCYIYRILCYCIHRSSIIGTCVRVCVYVYVCQVTFGNSVQCRYYFASLAGLDSGNANAVCPYTSVIGGGVCAATQFSSTGTGAGTNTGTSTGITGITGTVIATATGTV